MISHTVSISGTSLQTMATFVYDGNGNRVQQTDSSGSQPTTTTYINDVVGLTQVLVADDGTSQVYNLFGLDLIAQDDGIDTRTMLADGLGSVRTELVGGVVESTTTYDPYGNLLQQTGASGTTYGYTGEQQDSSTGLLYLRARYYNPALRSFMGRDPWSGNIQSPQSMNGWSYVENNPANLTDPTGQKPFPTNCWKAGSANEYENCVRDYYNVRAPGYSPVAYASDKFIPKQDEAGCYYGPVRYRAPGYVEGFSGDLAIITWNVILIGREVVYDFASMERERYIYYVEPGGYKAGSTGLAAVSATFYNGVVTGLRNWVSLNKQYEGYFGYGYLGGSTSTEYAIGIGAATGVLHFWGKPDFTIRGTAWYVAPSAGFSVPIFDLGGGTTYYEANGNYGREYDFDGDGQVDPDLIFNDVKKGLDGLDISDVFLPSHVLRWTLARHMVYKYSDIYNRIHHDSYPPGFSD